MKHVRRLLTLFAIQAAVVALVLSSWAVVLAAFVGPSAIAINGAFPGAEWGTTGSPATGVYVLQDMTNTGITDGSGFDGTAADIRYFWHAVSTLLGGSTEASPSNPVQNIYYRIDTAATSVINPGQIFNIQLNLGVAPAGKADHLLQIWVHDASTPKVKLVLYSYNTPYPSMGAFTTGSLVGRVSNVASPYSGYAGAVDADATGAYGLYDGTHYGIEVKIPVSWYGSTYGGTVKNDGSGAPTYYGVIFSSTGTLGAVGTVKDTIGDGDGKPYYFIVDPKTGETNNEELKLVSIVATKTDSIYTDVSPTGTASPGDILLYTVTITNNGPDTARNVLFEDTINDPYLSWADNVTVSPSRTVTNLANGCQVNIGNMTMGSSVTIKFRAQVKNPLPDTVSKVTNQGVVSGSNFTRVPTDDPRTLLASDATVTPVTRTEMVEPYKTWALTTDADGNGYPSPGDTLTYTVTIENLGNISATGVVFNDVPDPNSTLVTGSVTTTRGTVTKGNASGDSSVSVNVGSIPGGQGTPVTITFRVTVNSPLAAGVTQLSNQGVVTGSNFPADPTDDPTDQAYDNPTVTPLTATPLLEAFKRYELTYDSNGDGMAGPGDNLTYFITIINRGNQAATGIAYSDTLDANLTLFTGSTFTSQGTVTSESPISVDIGTMPGGSYTVTISFTAAISPGATGGIYNQGTVTATGLTDVLTDDPNTHIINDPTYTALAASPPELRVSKSALLTIDADNNGVPSPGDTLQYIIAINNNGGSAADNVTFTDTIDTNTTLIAGSTTTSQTATITETATTVTAVIGKLEGGATHSICIVTFKVKINSSFPDNVSTIMNQGNVTADGGISVQTDDPNTDTPLDATVTAVSAYPLITATKTDSIFRDVSPTGVASAGDTLLYTISITNSGTNVARSVMFNDTIGSYLTLAANSVTKTQGTVIKGNDPADQAVQVDLGDIQAGATIEIKFKVIIDSPLPDSVSTITNQGTVSGSNFAGVPTDDPRTLLASDATVTPVTRTEMVEPYKTWTLTTDADGNGYPSPGDTLTYTVTIQNLGSIAAEAAVFSDVPDANSTLVTGSVTTTRGTVANGNSAGDSSVSVNIGSIPGGQSTPVTITFRVIVNSPLPAGVTQLSNQGVVTGSNFPADPTDDPTDQAYDNPTVTPLTSAPLLEAFKRCELTHDSNGDGLAGPGDNLTYIISIINKGNQAATGVAYSDTLDANLTLFTGSTFTSQGTVTSESPITVDVGTMPGGNYTVNISFTAAINSGATGGIYNQGTVTATGLTDVPTDDPNTHIINDATYTALASSPAELRVSKSALLIDDADNNGMPSPGDTLQYIIAINNNGGSAAENIVFSDPLDANLTLVAGSTTTSQTATITEAPHLVTVNIAKLEGGSVHSICLITFRALINSPLPADNTPIPNQGTVTANGGISVQTDDPNTDAPLDATTITAYGHPLITATKTDALFNDVDGNGLPTPGDTLLYTITVSNSGSSPAGSVVFFDAISDGNLVLDDNVAAPLGGSIILGNNAGDKEVQVDFGDIAAGDNRTVTFHARISSPLPAGVLVVSNQGTVSGANFASVSTDDPRTSLASDATVTSVSAYPLVEPYKTWALTTDADHNGHASPGDTVTYTVIIENEGNQAATEAVFTDVPDPNTRLVAGSVTTTQGTINSGNAAGDTIVSVALGTLPGNHGSATITFRVSIVNPLPTGVQMLSNQGFVSGSNFPSDPTDDPSDQSYDNPTVTPLSTTPLLRAFKRWQLINDAAPIEGIPGPGDTIGYTIAITNYGNQNAAGVDFSDTPGDNVTLNTGSVTSSQGTVVQGNTGGDTSVEVSLGTIDGGGGTATVSFSVTVKDNGATLVSNQGMVSGPNFAAANTDDPTTTQVGDATETHLAIDTSPLLHVTKAVFLFNDADHNQVPSPGDTLQYIVTMNNSGNGPADNITFYDTPDANSTLVNGSVSSTLGTVQLGNRQGDRSVRVNIPTLGAGAINLVTFRVVINPGLSATTISNQGTVSGNNVSPILSGDPADGSGDSATVIHVYPNTQVIAAPVAAAPQEEERPKQSGFSTTPHSATTTRPYDPRPQVFPNLTVTSSNLSATQAKTGEPVTVEAVITNKGNASGSTNVTLYVNGHVAGTQAVSLAGGDSKPVSFTYSTDLPGEYTIRINNQPAGTLQVEYNIDSNHVLFISMACILGALLLGLRMIWLRRRQDRY